jgi:hypothetical protein
MAQSRTSDHLLHTFYGMTLLAKIALVLAAIALGGYNKFIGLPAASRSHEVWLVRATLQIESFLCSAPFFCGNSHVPTTTNCNVEMLQFQISETQMKNFKTTTITAFLLVAVSSLAGAAMQDSKTPVHGEHQHGGHEAEFADWRRRPSQSDPHGDCRYERHHALYSRVNIGGRSYSLRQSKIQASSRDGNWFSQ